MLLPAEYDSWWGWEKWLGLSLLQFPQPVPENHSKQKILFPEPDVRLINVQFSPGLAGKKLSGLSDSKLVANWRNSSCRMENNETHKSCESILEISFQNCCRNLWTENKKTKSSSSLWNLCVNKTDIHEPGSAPWVNHDARVPLLLLQADRGSLTMAHRVKTLNSKPGPRPPDLSIWSFCYMQQYTLFIITICFIFLIYSHVYR